MSPPPRRARYLLLVLPLARLPERDDKVVLPEWRVAHALLSVVSAHESTGLRAHSDVTDRAEWWCVHRVSSNEKAHVSFLHFRCFLDCLPPVSTEVRSFTKCGRLGSGNVNPRCLSRRPHEAGTVVIGWPSPFRQILRVWMPNLGLHE